MAEETTDSTTSWKTSLAGVITGVLGILTLVGITVPDTISSNVTLAAGILASIAVAVQGILTKDDKK